MSLQGRDLLRLLRQADQKVAAMDKMHFYVCQTDAIMSMSYYLAKAVTDSSRCTHDGTLRLMNACAQDMDDEAGNSNKEDVDNDDEESLAEDDLDKEMSSNEKKVRMMLRMRIMIQLLHLQWMRLGQVADSYGTYLGST